jgi:peptidoglycan hydrolase-like protein with peptidoglycan-binding domain
MRSGYIDDEAERFSRSGILVGVLTIGLGLAVLYNLAWVQADTPGPRLGGVLEPGVIQIDANNQTAKREPVIKSPTTKTHVEVKGSALPKPPAVKADPLVAAIERELIAAGNLNGPATGIPGQRVRDAIAAWQQRNGGPVTGAADQELLERLIYARQIREAMQFIPEMAEPETTPAPAPMQAASGDDPDMRIVQTGLAELGYRPGPINGSMSDQTSAAIRAFEKDRGMQPTGMVSARLLTELRKMAGDTQLAPLQ